METESYKARTEDVRRAARAHLADLRRARRFAKARADAGTADGADPDFSEDAPDSAPSPAEISNVDLAEMVESGPVADTEAANDLPMPPEPDEAADEAERLLDSMHIAEEGVADTDEVGAAPELPEEAGFVEANAAAEAGTVNEGAVEDTRSSGPDISSDLACLPGAGPGLIWMLNACDVHSLADLATQDPAELTEKLGVVGQIINVDHWVTLAQAGPSSD